MKKYNVIIDMGKISIRKTIELSDEAYRNIENLFACKVPAQYCWTEEKGGESLLEIGTITDIELVNEDNKAMCNICDLAEATQTNNTLCEECWSDAEGLPIAE